jgi:predicted PurR-regulated permease PerM
VAVGQGLYLYRISDIWGSGSGSAFCLTAAASVIPVVGTAIVYVPVCIFMIAEGNTGQGLGLQFTV